MTQPSLETRSARGSREAGGPTRDDDVIIDLAFEGGGATIRGWKGPDGWVFSSKAVALMIGDDDVDFWKSGEWPNETDLLKLLPPDWEVMVPLIVHDAFKAWFREQRAKVLATLPEHRRRNVEERVGRRWDRILG